MEKICLNCGNKFQTEDEHGVVCPTCRANMNKVAKKNFNLLGLFESIEKFGWGFIKSFSLVMIVGLGFMFILALLFGF
jgi:hypothetical protein